MEEKEVKKKERLYTADAVASAVMCGVTLIFFLLASISEFGFLALAAGLWFGWSMNLRVKRIAMRRVFPAVIRTAVAVVLFAAALITPSIGFSTDKPWKLDFQTAYTNMYNNVKMPEELLPPGDELIRSVRAEYHQSYASTMFGKQGHFTVSYLTTVDKAKEFQQVYSQRAVASCPLQMITDPTAYRSRDVRTLLINDKEKAIEEILYSESEYNSPTPPPDGMTVQIDYNFWQGRDQNAVIYLLESSGSGEDIRTTAVIIDTQLGAVEFAQYG